MRSDGTSENAQERKWIWSYDEDDGTVKELPFELEEDVRLRVSRVVYQKEPAGPSGAEEEDAAPQEEDKDPFVGASELLAPMAVLVRAASRRTRARARPPAPGARADRSPRAVALECVY